MPEEKGGFWRSVGSALPFIGGLLNNRWERKAAQRNTDLTIRANRELAEYAYSKDLEMWNRQNEYNSPEAQMSRLRGSGLNPNLVYGNGTVGNQSGAIPQYNAPTAQHNYAPMKVPDMLGIYQDFQMRQAQIDNVKAQTENVNQRTVAEALGVDIRSELRGYNAEITANQAWQSRTKVNQELERLDFLQRTKDVRISREQAEAMMARLRANWMEKGISPNDNPILRILSKWLMDQGLSLPDLEDPFPKPSWKE